MAIIRSLLDTDLYKFTMLQVVLHQFPETHSVYEFRCRNATTVYPLADIQADFEREIDAYCASRRTNCRICAACASSKAILSIIWNCSSSNAASSASIPMTRAGCTSVSKAR